MAFLQKTINSSLNLGIDLRDLRERRGLTLEEACAQTKILLTTLRNWEEDRWETEDPFYDERQLRAYVQFLGGNEAYILKKYRDNIRERRFKPNQEHLTFREKNVRFFDLAVSARIWAILGILLLAFGLGSYVYFLIHRVSALPMLEIDEPQDGTRVTDPKLTIRGKTQSETTIIVNQKNAIVQPDGSFFIELILPRGSSEITIQAKRRQGIANTKTLHVLYDRPLPTLDEVSSPIPLVAPSTSTSSTQP